MKILLIGSGGREHALAKAITKSGKHTLFIAPGNPGTAQFGKNLPIKITDFEGIRRYIRGNSIEIVVIGPEMPLVEGIVDFLGDTEVLVIGPTKTAAQLEGSKAFAKQFMVKYGILTATHKHFGLGSEKHAIQYLQDNPYPLVLKADGLASGKGVIICKDYHTAKPILKEMMNGGLFGKAGKTVVIEQFLKGEELSVFIVADRKNYIILPSAKDYKKIGDGNTGKNTGGMGAISPSPLAEDSVFMQKVIDKIIEPTLNGLAIENIYYSGFLYFGLMKVGNEPFLIEYNIRLGDPEAQVVLSRLETDIVDIFQALGNHSLSDITIQTKSNFAAAVVCASSGYPTNKMSLGLEISGLDEVTQSVVYQSGTKMENGILLTAGGRVLSIVAMGADKKEVLQQCYSDVKKIDFDGKVYRKDIGK